MNANIGTGPSTGKLRNRVLLLLLFAAGIAGFYFSGLSDYVSWDSLRAHRDEWRQQVEAHLVAAVAVFLVLSVVLMTLSLPVGSFVSLAGGALFGLWMGVGLVSIASTIGATLAFLSSRYIFRDWVRRHFARWVGPVDRGFARSGIQYLLFLRLSPVVPFFAVNPVMGLTQMRTRTFVWVSLIGMLPGSFLYVNVGTELGRINSPGDILSWRLFVSFLLLALVPFLLKWVLPTKPDAPIPPCPTTGSSAPS